MLKPFRLLPAALMVGIAAQGAQAQSPASQQQAQAPQQMSKADFMRSIDARFGSLDTNKDGTLDKAEISAAHVQVLKQAAAAQQKQIEESFRKLDTNKDNQLSLAEFKAGAPPVQASQTPDQMLAQLDANKDGRVSQSEYRAAPLASFDKTDTNKDGTITAAELQAARKNNQQ